MAFKSRKCDDREFSLQHFIRRDLTFEDSVSDDKLPVLLFK